MLMGLTDLGSGKYLLLNEGPVALLWPLPKNPIDGISGGRYVASHYSPGNYR